MMLKFAHNSLDLKVPKVMGILNVTPDSFFDGGKYISDENILARAEQLTSEGASIIDVGGYSTRPGARNVTEQVEAARILPAIKLIRTNFPKAIISVDTFRSSLAEKAVENGADMINDISGGNMDDKMFEIVGKLKVPYVLTHIKGTPQTMQVAPKYDDVIAEVSNYFVHRINFAVTKGIEQIIIDPGFGFGKTVEHNFILLDQLSEFKRLGFPILAGLSRKSMINKIIGTEKDPSLAGTTAAHTIALRNGADILRVHDVKEAIEAIKICSFVKEHEIK